MLIWLVVAGSIYIIYKNPKNKNRISNEYQTNIERISNEYQTNIEYQTNFTPLNYFASDSN